MKELKKKNLDMENEKIRKKRQLKSEKAEVSKLKVQLEDLHHKEQKSFSDTDHELTDLEEELEIKQRRLKNINKLIKEFKEKSMKKKEKSMSKANRMVQEIEEAIDNVNIPIHPITSKAVNRTHVYNKPINEEEKIPIATKIEEIFIFAEKEIKKVASEKEKAEIEYKLISGLKNNLHKENITWKNHVSNSGFRARGSLAEIQSKMEEQSTALESERRDLTNKIDR